MNIRRIWFWIVLFGLVSSFSTAQRHEIGVTFGGINYVGEIGSTQYIQPRHLEIGLIYKRNYNERIGLRAIYSRGKLSGNDLNASELDRLKRGYSFANNYSSLGAAIEINYVKLPVGEFGFSWTPYIHAGVNRVIVENIFFDPIKTSSSASRAHLVKTSCASFIFFLPKLDSNQNYNLIFVAWFLNNAPCSESKR